MTIILQYGYKIDYDYSIITCNWWTMKTLNMMQFDESAQHYAITKKNFSISANSASRLRMRLECTHMTKREATSFVSYVTTQTDRQMRSYLRKLRMHSSLKHRLLGKLRHSRCEWQKSPCCPLNQPEQQSAHSSSYREWWKACWCHTVCLMCVVCVLCVYVVRRKASWPQEG